MKEVKKTNKKDLVQNASLTLEVAMKQKMSRRRKLLVIEIQRKHEHTLKTVVQGLGGKVQVIDF